MRDIPGFEKLYAVTKSGKIWSYPKYYNPTEGRWLKPYKVKGYLRVSLSNKGKRKVFYVHYLVAITYIPKLKNKVEINHINGIKKDNSVENLEWVTHQENCHHAAKNNLSRRKLTKGDADYIRILKRVGFTYNILAGIYEVSASCIRDITLNRTYLY